MSRSVPGLAAACLLAASVVAPPGASAEAENTVGAVAVVAKHEPAVVSVKSVASMKTSFGGREASQEEQENECTGIVVSPSGLVLVSLSAVDPSDMYAEYMKQMGEQSEQMSFTAELKSITVRLSDGSEVPAEVAIRDRDLDIAVLKPRAQIPGSLPYVDLSASTDVGLLDDLLLVSRLGKEGSWIAVAGLEKVKGIFTKPRKMYFVPYSPSGEDTDVGALALTPDGKIVGMHLYRRVAGAAGRGPSYFMVVMPAKELLAVVRQVQ
ncbi:MAG: hypothetical protein KatS3mg024_2616 [Armatimonadota bacterium]|nr:MAG: hypothetical protein KatS3mg024_2616 [Armatimonadota bacterium]